MNSLALQFEDSPDNTRKPIVIDLANHQGKQAEDSILNRQSAFDILNYKISLPTSDGLSMVRIRTILYFQAEGNYTFVHLDNGKKILVSKTLKEFEAKLNSATFCRIHRSTLVNLTKVSKYIKGRGGLVVLDNGTQLAVSTRKKEEIIDVFNQFFI